MSILACNTVSRAEEIASHSLELQKAEARLFPFGETIRWSRFVEKLYRQTKGEILRPLEVVVKLIDSYLCFNHSSRPILDVGCELGKNALPLLKAGHEVVILDIAPNALQYTLENLRISGKDGAITDTILSKIEKLDSRQGPFKAVVGTYAFSFISPDLFEEVMEENVLERIELGGFFAGGFFGPEHVWARNPRVTLMTAQKIVHFFSLRGFFVWEITERKKEGSTVWEGRQTFHTLEVIAQRILGFPPSAKQCYPLR